MILHDVAVLIVEDEPLIALQLEEAALELGADRTVSSRTREALGVLEKAEYAFGAAVVAARATDELAVELMGALDRRRIPFVMTTTDAVVTLPAGISVTHRVVAKPFSNEDILAAIRGLLDRAAPPVT